MENEMNVWSFQNDLHLSSFRTSVRYIRYDTGLTAADRDCSLLLSSSDFP